MSTIFGQDAEVSAQGAGISLPKSRAIPTGGSSAANVATALAGVATILGSLPKEDKTSKIATSLDRRVRSIEIDDTMNSFQKADAKSRALNASRIKAGPNGRTFIDEVFDAARTKQEISPVTGQVQFVNVGTGETVRLGTDTPEGVQVEAIQKASATVDEFFPSISDVADTLLTKQIAENVDPVTREDALTGVIGNFAEVAGKIQNVHDRVSMSLNVPAEQQEKLIEFADREYISAGTQMLNTFYQDVFVESLQGQGGMSPEDAMELVNAAERDFIDEVSSSGVPNDMAKLKSHMRGMKEDLSKFFTTAGTKDIAELTRAKNRLLIGNEITKQSFLNDNPNIIKIGALEHTAQIGISMTELSQDLRRRSLDPQATAQDKANVDNILRDITTVQTSIAETFNKSVGSLTTTADKIGRLRVGLSKPTTQTQFTADITLLQSLLQDPNSVMRNPELKELRDNEFVSSVDHAVTEGWIEEETGARYMQQLGVAVSKNDANIRAMGHTEESWQDLVKQGTQEVMSWLGDTFGGSAAISAAERTPEGKLKEPEPVVLKGATDEQ